VLFRSGHDLTASPHWPVRAAGGVVDQLGNLFIYKRPGIVLAQFLCSVSFAIRTLKATFDSLPARPEQVAMTLGCDRAAAFWKVTLPMARPGILAAAVLSWSRAFGVFGAVTIVAGAVRNRTEVLPTAIYLEFSIGRIEAALAISLVLLGVALVVLLLMRVWSGANLFGLGGRP
jgi:molybdate transport system permease protein